MKIVISLTDDFSDCGLWLYIDHDVKAARATMSIAWKHSFAQGNRFFFSKLLAQIQMIYIAKNHNVFYLVIDSKSLIFNPIILEDICKSHRPIAPRLLQKYLILIIWHLFFNSTLLQNKDLLVGVKVIVSETEN